MITAARQILENKEIFSKATVILMIDRNELEGQLYGWVDRILGELQSLDIKIEPATSKRRLRELLKSDFRGLIISMIHKFDKISKNICPRDNVFAMADEAHRSFGKDLGNYLLAALPDATMIGFTGTPIDKTAYGKGTFKIFGKEDDKGYLDKYSMKESIEDGTTLLLNYALASNDMRVPQEDLEKEFLSLVEAEGVCEIDELNKILDKTVNLKSFLKLDDRIEKVSKLPGSFIQVCQLDALSRAYTLSLYPQTSYTYLRLTYSCDLGKLYEINSDISIKFSGRNNFFKTRLVLW